MRIGLFVVDCFIVLFLSFGFGGDELLALAVDVDDFDRRIIFEVHTPLGDIHVHASCIEVVVINPDSLKREISFENLIHMSAKEAKEF